MNRDFTPKRLRRAYKGNVATQQPAGHGDRETVERKSKFWQETKARILAGKVPDFYPYPEAPRFCMTRAAS